jgi:MFS family permease
VGLALLLFSAFKYYHAFVLSRLIVTLLVIALGFGCSVIYISAQTFLHIKTEGHFRGRVFGIVAMLINLAMSIPALAVGGISDATSPFVAMVALSIFILSFGIFISLRYKLYSEEKKSISMMDFVA